VWNLDIFRGVELLLGESVLPVDLVDTTVYDGDLFLGNSSEGVGWHVTNGVHDVLQIDRVRVEFRYLRQSPAVLLSACISCRFR